MFSLILVLFVSLMLPGVIQRTRAILSGRKGVKLYQHINNVGLLLRKGSVYSPTTSLIFRVAPAIYLGAALTAMLFIPIGGHTPIFSFNGDVVMFTYLLALSRFVLIIAAMDTGSSFEGMGASREALYGALIEPAMFTVFGTLALVSGQTSFHSIFVNMSAANSEMIIVMVLLLYVIYKIITVESGRIPVDDPKTHLELTMIHEVMILDYAGVDLAYITIASWVKMGMFAVIAANALAGSLMWSPLIVVVIALAQGVFVGGVESLIARNRLSRNSTYILTILSVALVLLVVCYLLSHNINIG